MSLQADLLDQAYHLAHRKPRRPRQASLRRAVSTAYYALFHLLVEEAKTTLIKIGFLRDRFARAFEHSDMKHASKAFRNPQANLTILTGGVPIPPELRRVAETFTELQEARHDADYNVAWRFTRLEANDLVLRAERAFQDWLVIRNTPVAHIYLAALLLWKKWNR